MTDFTQSFLENHKQNYVQVFGKKQGLERRKNKLANGLGLQALKQPQLSS